MLVSLPNCLQPDKPLVRLRHAIQLPIYAAALLLVFLGVLGVLFWPAWSEDARRRRLGIIAALTGGDWPEQPFAEPGKVAGARSGRGLPGCGSITAIAWAPDEDSPWRCLGTFREAAGRTSAPLPASTVHQDGAATAPARRRSSATALV
jgi:hypothetical protein